MEYKPYREKTSSEKAFDKWNQDGQPRLIWDSSKRGTYQRKNLEHQEIVEGTIESFRAPLLEWSHLQPHKRT